MTHRAGRGFTLVELLLVIAIIAMLIAMFITGGTLIRETLSRAHCASNLGMLAKAYMAYVETSNQGNFPPVWHVSENRGPTQGNPEVFAGWFPIDPCNYVVNSPRNGQRSFVAGFGPLVFEKYVDDSDLFVCPKIHAMGEDWWHKAPKPDGERIFFHDAGTNWDPMDSYDQWLRGNRRERGYSSAAYQIRMGLFPRSRQWLMDEGITAFMADNHQYHYTDDAAAEFDVIRQRHVTGVNVAYIDGGVQYREDDIMFTDNYDRPRYRPLNEEHANDVKQTKAWAIWKSFDRRE
jgi:prepilin-type N-terminal cleavage/methylation domain-containing protein